MSFWKTQVGARVAALILVAGVAMACSAGETASVTPTTQNSGDVAPVTVTETVTVTNDAPPADAQEQPAQNAENGQSQPTAMVKLNLNTATQDQLLATIPNFGNRMVREFFEYRPYVSIQQFRREIGKYVDDAQVATYEQYVYVPIKVNESDAETLKQLPGVDDAIAAALIAARPYDSSDAFLAKLAESASAEELASAAAYLEQ